MTTPAQVLLAKLHPSKISKKAASRISADKALSDFADHLKWLASRHLKKPYSEEYLVDRCFAKTRALKTPSEVNSYCRPHLAAAINSFDELLKTMRGKSQKVSHATLKRCADIVTDYIFDLKEIAEHLERQKDPKYSFFKGGKNYGVHTFEVFRLSRQLAVQSAFRGMPFHVDHKTAQIASMFVLRQALEKRFERLIGVQIYNSSLQTPKLRHDFHYDFIAKHPAYFDFRAVNFSRLTRIYDWCSEVVHRAYQPLAWQIDFAHSICGRLFNPIPTPPGAGWSIHNSVKITNLSEMQSAFMKHFKDSYEHGNWILEAVEPEAEVK